MTIAVTVKKKSLQKAGLILMTNLLRQNEYSVTTTIE
jgi:hypothetical protein